MMRVGPSEELDGFEEPPDSKYSKEPEEKPRVTTVEVDQAFKTAVNDSSYGQEEEITWVGKFKFSHICHHDSTLALLLPTLLKVQKLDIRLRSGFSNYYLERMIGRAARRERPFGTRPPFEALTSFVHSHKAADIRSTSFLASLLQLPAIKEISGGFGVCDMWNYDSDEEQDLAKLESASSPLISLNLTAYDWISAYLSCIVQNPKALKTFFYTFHSDAGINFRKVRDALGPQANCLESLGFDYDEDYERYDRSAEPDGTLYGPEKSFISFKSLKVFKTAALFLERPDSTTKDHGLVDILPPSLETLHLTRFHARSKKILEALVQLLGQKSPQQMPSLTKLILEEAEPCEPGVNHDKLIDVKWKRTNETAIGILSKVAAAKGVSIDVTYC